MSKPKYVYTEIEKFDAPDMWTYIISEEVDHRTRHLTGQQVVQMLMDYQELKDEKPGSELDEGDDILEWHDKW